MHKGYKRISVGELCEFINGNGFRPPDWKPSGLLIIRIQNLNGSQNFNYFDGVPKDKWIVEPGDLLFAWAGVKGVSFGPTIWPGPRGVLNQHIFRVAPKNVIDRYWLYLALQVVTRRVEENAHGFKASLVHVHKDDITDQIVDLPPIAEQRRIAEILRTWDEAIEKLGELRAAKKQRLDGLRSGLLFGALRLDGKPANWQPRRLSEVTFELSERNADMSLGRDAVMGVTNSRGIVPMREQTVAEDISRYKRLPPRAFAYNPMRINVGSIAMNEGERDILVSPDYVAFACKANGLEPDYLNHLRKTRWWTHHITSGGSGSVRQRTYYDDLAALQLLLPDVDEQRRIVSVLNTASDDLNATERMIKSWPAKNAV